MLLIDTVVMMFNENTPTLPWSNRGPFCDMETWTWGSDSCTQQPAVADNSDIKFEVAWSVLPQNWKIVEKERFDAASLSF